MALTAQLGTVDSTLGNIVLAYGVNSTAATYTKSASNSLSLNQSATTQKSVAEAASSTLTLTQRANNQYRVSGTSTLVLSGVAVAELIGNTELDATLTLTQTVSVGHGRTVAQSLAFTQTINLGHGRTVEQTLTFTQEATKVLLATADSTLTLSHAVVVAKSRLAIASNALVLSSSVAKELTINRTINQGLLFIQSAPKNIYRNVSTASSVSLAQSAVAVLTKLTSSSLVLSQSATYVSGKHVHHSIELTQTGATSVTYMRPVFSAFIPFQTVARNTTIRRTLPQTLTFTQSAVGHVVKSASSSLILTQSATETLSKPGVNSLVLAQSVVLRRGIGLTVLEPLYVLQSVVCAKSKALAPINYLGFNQFARGTRRLSVTVTSTLALAQDLVRYRCLEDITHSVNLVQVAVGHKVAAPASASSLTLTQSVTVSKTIVRHLSSVLSFSDSFEKYTGIASHPTVSIPHVQVVNVTRGPTGNGSNCTVVLQNGSLAIVLPCPEFGDSEAGTGTINVKRTMGGTRRVYKRENPTSKLHYSFIMDRKKAIELRNFILSSSTAFLRMQNWKGELWAVQMTNSPFSFSEDAAWLDSTGGNRSSITLEFEGVRLN